jgi:hypothetical protein
MQASPDMSVQFGSNALTRMNPLNGVNPWKKRDGKKTRAP